MLNLVTAIILILFAAFSRLMPHPANFTSVGAIALFSGAYLNKKYLYIVPIASMIVSDFILGFHNTMIWVYGSFILIGLIGLWLKSHVAKDATFKKIGFIFGSTLLSSVLFFIITNFGMWTTGFYGLTWNGLIECYTMAIPFFRNTLAGDVFYVAVMFGIYELVLQYTKTNEVVKVK